MRFLLWQPELRGSKNLASHADSLGTFQKPEDIVLTSLFFFFFFSKHWQESFLVCVCTEQTGLLYLCIAAEAGSSSSQRGLLPHPLLVPHLLSSPLLSSSFSFSSLRVKWLFVLLQRCLSLVSPPLPPVHTPLLPIPSLRVWKDILVDRSCLSCEDLKGVWLSLSLCENGVVGFYTRSPPSLSHPFWWLVFIQEPHLFSPCSCVSTDVKYI